MKITKLTYDQIPEVFEAWETKKAPLWPRFMVSPGMTAHIESAKPKHGRHHTVENHIVPSDTVYLFNTEVLDNE